MDFKDKADAIKCPWHYNIFGLTKHTICPNVRDQILDAIHGAYQAENDSHNITVGKWMQERKELVDALTAERKRATALETLVDRMTKGTM